MCSKMVLSVFVFVFHVLLLHGINCTEFEVGDTNNLTKGWEVPPLNHPHVYNQWAQNNRFKVNDTLRKYSYSFLCIYAMFDNPC